MRSEGDSELRWREREVLQLLAQGLSNKEISDRLGIAVPTVKANLKSISEKLKLKGRVRIALFARSVL
jgi:DNA-binding CsgD family transcriptional regulator